MSLSKLFLTICVLCLCLCVDVSAKSKKNKTAKTEQLGYTTPVPDVMQAVAPRDPNLPSNEEAMVMTYVPGEKIEGIDVSHYQGRIDWKAIADEGVVQYAFLKSTEGSGLVDETYDYNLRQAHKYGIKVGSYHFFRANAPIREQLDNMFSVVKGAQQDLLPIVDVEHLNKVRPTLFVERLKQFLNAVTEHYGHKPILYTFVNFYNKYLRGEGFDDYVLMIAFYRDDPPLLDDERPYAIWQYTAYGDVPGILGNCDRSCMMEGYSLNDIIFK